MEYNWNWGVLFQDPFFDWLVLGVQWTFAVALAAWVIALTVGIIVGVGRTLQQEKQEQSRRRRSHHHLDQCQVQGGSTTDPSPDTSGELHLRALPA